MNENAPVTPELAAAHGLTEDEILGMVKAGIEHGKEDMETRWLVEARTEADIVLNAARKALEQARGAGVPEERLAAFSTQLDELGAARDLDDHGKIRQTLRSSATS